MTSLSALFSGPWKGPIWITPGEKPGAKRHQNTWSLKGANWQHGDIMVFTGICYSEQSGAIFIK
ncbi:hypothetical protein DDZ16_19485 [Marinilabilia rubra]|uniref:Uncharacterized protein n=1 Tax=Marinilabilia rubra TaxID=2162893 RepID=A0A2U2B3N8_9BACT|nr:hypothetical protein DDZ16_19485 [Marinilabilia rubra]